MSSSTLPVPPGDAPNQKPAPAQPARTRAQEERDWYASSYELARGLQVDEVTDHVPLDMFFKPKTD